MNYTEARLISTKQKASVPSSSSSQARLRGGAKSGGQGSRSGLKTPHQSSQKSILQPSQSYKRLNTKPINNQQQSGQHGQQQNPQSKEQKGAPLAPLTLNAPSSRPSLQQITDAPPKALKAKAAVLPAGRVNTAWRNIQPIRKQVDYNVAKIAGTFRRENSNKMKNKVASTAEKTSVASAHSSSQQIDLKNCKSQMNTSKISSTSSKARSYQRIQKQYHDYRRRVQMGPSSAQSVSQKFQQNFNGDLTLTSPDATTSEGPNGTVPTHGQASEGEDHDSSLERDDPHDFQLQPRNTGAQNRSGEDSSGSEEGDDYCVDDDEDDEELEREDPNRSKEEQISFQRSEPRNNYISSNHKGQMTVESRRLDQVDESSKDAAFFSAQGSQPPLTVVQDSQLPMREESSLDEHSAEFQDATHFTQGHYDTFNQSTFNQNRSSAEMLKSRNGAKTSASAEDVITVKRDSDTSPNTLEQMAEIKSTKSIEEVMPRQASADKHNMSGLESSTIKTNQTPIKYQDQNFLLPIKSSEKKFDNVEQQALLSHFNMFEQQQQEQQAALVESGDVKSKARPYQVNDAVKNLSRTFSKSLAGVYGAKDATDADHSRNSPNCIEGPEPVPKQRAATTGLPGRNVKGHARQASLLDVPAEETDPSPIPPLAAVGPRQENKLDIEKIKKYEQTLQLPLNGRRNTEVHQASGGSATTLQVSEEPRRKSADKTLNGKLNSTGGGRSIKSTYSSQVSKAATTSQKTGDSPFSAVLAHQQRSGHFSFPKGSRGLLPVQEERTGQRTHQEARKSSNGRNKYMKIQDGSSLNQSKSGGSRGSRKSATTPAVRQSPRFNTYSRKRSSLSSLQGAQRSNSDLGPNSTYVTAKQNPGTNVSVSVAAQHEQSAIGTQESMKSLTTLHCSQQVSLPTVHQAHAAGALEEKVPDIDSGEQIVGNMTDGSKGSLDDTKKRQEVFNATTNLHSSAASMRRFDCKSSKMFNSASVQSSASAAVQNGRLAAAAANESAGKLFTLRQLAQQAIANSLGEEPGPQKRGGNRGDIFSGEKANSHTSGTATYYVDDVSSSPNKDYSLSQTDQKIQMTFSNLTNQQKAMYSNEYHLSNQLSRKDHSSVNLKEDLGVCSFEVTLHTQMKEKAQRRSRHQSEGSDGTPKPQYLACMPQTQNKELARVQQRIQQQEQVLLRRQQEIEQQNKEFQGQVEAQRQRKQQKNGRRDHQQSMQQTMTGTEGRLFAGLTGDGGSCERTTHNHTNSNSLQTAKFNEFPQGSVQSCQETTLWQPDSLNFYASQRTDGQYQEAIQEEEQAPRFMVNQQLPYSPATQEYSTAQGFDERIDLIGHGEIKNMDSTQNGDSSAGLSSSLPFQSQTLSQMFRELKNQAAVEMKLGDPREQARSDEEIIQEAIRSIASHLPPPHDSALGPQGLTGQQCMNYNHYLEHMQTKGADTIVVQAPVRASMASVKSPGVESVKRSSCSTRQQSAARRHSAGRARKPEYAPVLHQSEPRGTYSSKIPTRGALPKKSNAGHLKSSAQLPRWNISTSTRAGHRRTQSQAQHKPILKKIPDISSQDQQIPMVKTHHIVCHARSTSGQGAKSQLNKKASAQSIKKRSNSKSKLANRNISRASSHSSIQRRRKRSTSKKVRSREAQRPVGGEQPCATEEAVLPDFDYKMESQTLEMSSYMKKEIRQAQQDQQDHHHQAQEVKQMFNGRQQVYSTLDKSGVHRALELPLSMESINYCDRSAEEQFQSIDFFGCHGNVPLTVESKASQGPLPRQLVESFNDPKNAALPRGKVFQNDSLDLRASSSKHVRHATLPGGQHMEMADVGSDQRISQPSSHAVLQERLKDSAQSDYHDFVRLNHLSSYAEPLYGDAAGSDLVHDDLYNAAPFGAHQAAAHHDLQNPQVLHMIQKANQLVADHHEIMQQSEPRPTPEPQQMEAPAQPDPAHLSPPGQPPESAETTAERPRSRPASQTQQIRREPQQQMVEGAEPHHLARTDLQKTDYSMNADVHPSTSSLHDYMKVVKKRVTSRYRRSNSTDYQRRFLSHAKYKPPVSNKSTLRRSHQSMMLRGRRHDTSIGRISHVSRRGTSNGRRSISNNNRSLEGHELTLGTDQSFAAHDFQSELNEKQQLEQMKNHLARQKQHERVLLEKHNLIKKQQIMQTKKQVGLLHNKTQQIFDRTQKKKVMAKRAAAELKVVINNKLGEEKAIENHQQDLRELERLRETLRAEMELEAQLVEDIRSITHKYKRLVAEQTREKEKLAQAVRGQQSKILKNLKERSRVLRQDNAKLYSEFRSTMSNGSVDRQHNSTSGNRPASRQGSMKRSSSKLSVNLKKSQSLSRKSSKNRMSSMQQEKAKGRISASRLPPSYIR